MFEKIRKISLFILK